MKSILVNQLKRSYSWYVRHLSKRASNQPLKKEIVYLLSFPNNNKGLIEALSETYKVTVCYTKERKKEASKLAKHSIMIMPIDTKKGLQQTIEAITTSQIVIADNYFPFLGDVIKRSNQSFFQIWHATGAIKQFGLEDKTAMKRSLADKKRFKRVYESFDYFVVSSKAMGDVFKRSYGANETQLIYTGFPRTDKLLSQANNYTDNKKQKKIVYLPTYRTTKEQMDLKDMEYLVKELGEDYELYIKTHPHVDIEKNKLTHGNIHIVDALNSADDLLMDADVLITDYSSVAFDYSLIKQRGCLIFYWYDETTYQETTGLQPKIKETFPNEVCHTVDEIVKQIKTNNQSLETFNKTWNTYNDGKATERFEKIIKEKMG